MNFIVVISTQEDLNDKIRSAFSAHFPGVFSLYFPQSEKSLFDALNFEIPEIVLLNFTDPKFNPQFIKETILEDSWLHNFGIIGLFDGKVAKDSEILEDFKELNILTLMDYARINRELVKSIDIIYKNRQLILQEFLADKLVGQFTGTFNIENPDITVVPVYSGLLSLSLARMGRIPEDGRFNLQMALTELVVNGIEHGNCKINFEEKTEFLMKGGGMHELVAEKNKDPDVARKKVTVNWEISEDLCRFVIEDEGDGFDVTAYRQKLKKNSQDSLHGRGIIMANMVADKITYNLKGNRVTLQISNKDRKVERKFPLGFAREEVMEVSPGDVVMKSGDMADCIYYISSGEFTVYYKDTPVGKITSADIFMGEMAFLLNNRRSATVIAIKPGKIVKIPRRSFISVIKDYPQYSVFIAKLLAQKLARANEKTTDIAGFYRELGFSIFENGTPLPQKES
jgi:anti-sigma regulatory factor (Ser/Thr protein kinase)